MKNYREHYPPLKWLCSTGQQFDPFYLEHLHRCSPNASQRELVSVLCPLVEGETSDGWSYSPKTWDGEKVEFCRSSGRGSVASYLAQGLKTFAF